MGSGETEKCIDTKSDMGKPQFFCRGNPPLEILFVGGQARGHCPDIFVGLHTSDLVSLHFRSRSISDSV